MIVPPVPLNYPLTARFSLLAIGQTVRITDAAGQQILYVKQKAFRLRTDVVVYADETRQQPVYLVRGDRVMGAVKYSFSTPEGRVIGSLRRQWASFLWSATYRMFDANDTEIGLIRQQNPWIRVLHGLVEEVPILGALVGSFVNPTYRVDVPEGTTVMRLVKKASFTSRTFVIESVVPLGRDAQLIVVPAVITFVLMERARA